MNQPKSKSCRLLSIIVPIRYRPDLTRVCLDSIIAYTKHPYELILVQEGEDEPITTLLKSYKAEYVQNKTPKGFAGAMNAGISVATGDVYCFLNNDTVVTPGWEQPIMEVLDDEKVGLVSPLFTEATTNQSIENTDRPDVDHIDDPLSLKGVCFFVPAGVIKKIGMWDENFGLGGGDDNDMCYRIKQGGFKLVVARKSYIYHYNSASFREEFKNDKDFSKRFAVEQFNKFRVKHNLNTGKPTVFLSIPCFDGSIRHELALRLVQWSHDPDIQLKIKFYPNLAPIDNARNRAVKDFLEEYCDYFMHVDDDIVPPENTIRELLKADKDVIAPLCFTMHSDDKGFQFPIIVAHRYNKDMKYEPYYGKGIEETDTITGGCHLVKRAVMEKLERPYYFTYHKNGLVEYSEDFVFSQQCQKLGYKLNTHYGLLCKHIRLVDVKGINDLMAKYGR